MKENEHTRKNYSWNCNLWDISMFSKCGDVDPKLGINLILWTRAVGIHFHLFICVYSLWRNHWWVHSPLRKALFHVVPVTFGMSILQFRGQCCSYSSQHWFLKQIITGFSGHVIAWLQPECNHFEGIFNLKRGSLCRTFILKIRTGSCTWLSLTR